MSEDQRPIKQKLTAPLTRLNDSLNSFPSETQRIRKQKPGEFIRRDFKLEQADHKGKDWAFFSLNEAEIHLLNFPTVI